MKQVIQNFRSGGPSVRDVPESICKDGGILVRNAASLISPGTEKLVVDLARKSLAGKAKERPDLIRNVVDKIKRDGLINTLRIVKSRLDTPIALGYSCAGIVRQVGPGAEEFRCGDRVACAGMNYASHAETVFIPKNLAVKIPDEISFDEAAFVTLGAIALQGVRTAEVTLGDTVAVIGLGLIGQLTVQTLKSAGCRVAGIDLEESKIELARNHGAELSILRSDDVIGALDCFTGGYGVDAVIITAASVSNDPINIAGAIARDRAIISIVGAVKIDVPRKVYYEKELQIRLSRSYGPGRYDVQYEEQGIDYPIGFVRWTERRNMQEFLRLVAARAVRLDQLITHRYPIEEAEKAYELITGETNEDYMGILLKYDEPSGIELGSRTITLKEMRGDGQLKLGVIGAGNFAKSILLPRLAKIPNVSLIGISTSTGHNAKAIGEQYGFGLCTTDYRELLKREDLDTVIIATRHNTHCRMTAEAIRAGKTVYVEKPLAITEEELFELVDTVDRYNGRVMVGFNRRFSSLSIELKRFFNDAGPLAITYRINAGAIPKESWIMNDEGGGRILGEVCHFIDYLQYLTDADPVEVCAYQNSAGADTLSIIIKLSDGSTGNINYFANGDRLFPKERIEVYGGGRIAVLDDFRALEMWRDGKRKKKKLLIQDKGFERELRTFIEAACVCNQMPITWRSLVLTTLATLKVVESVSSGKSLIVDV
ncbi:MAG: bi-domain-containing oxidoreductase [Acidobacteria bacterium]|nr:bi-domain-containing oxidoreductase [Acidobacteriota bacterium]